MLAKLDFSLLKLTMKIAHYLDYRFHWNNYFIAAKITQFVAVCLVGQVVYYFGVGEDRWFLWFLVIANPICVLGIWLQYNRLVTCSKKYERDPTTIPREAHGYILDGMFLRLFGIMWGLIFLAPMILQNSTKYGVALAIVSVIFCGWLTWDSVAMYFAGIPPSSRKRKEKKAYNWSFGMTPQPIRN